MIYLINVLTGNKWVDRAIQKNRIIGLDRKTDRKKIEIRCHVIITKIRFG